MAQFDEERIEEVFYAALDVPESERAAFVAAKCENEAECIREVNSLLKARSVRGMLDEPVVVLGVQPEPSVGTTVDGRYVIDSELPHGGMSEAYVAFDKRLNNQRVVVKVLSKDLVQNLVARQHVEQEVAALQLLRSPSVVRVTDRNVLPDGRPYIVMDYVEGEPLRTQIRPNEGMDLKRVALILAQVGAALEYVHQNGVIHRDVKPENIMLARDTGSVVLIDFGIAKVMDSVVALSTVEGASAGTLVYMSPEQLRAADVSAASDVYSMAVVAYEMITGRRPFAPHSHAEMLELQRRGVRAKPTDLRPDLSKNAERIILRALSFEPNYRYKSAKRFGDELAKALNESRSDSDSSVRRRMLLTVAGVFILALISYGIYRYLVNPLEETPQTQRQGLISTATPNPPPEQSKGFNYWLTVQPTRDGETYGKSYKSNGKDKFQNGEKFQLNIRCLDSGYVYIFNEAPEAGGFRLIYPRKKTGNNVSAAVGADQTAQTDWHSFRGPSGSNNSWIVWSASPIRELEFAKDEALKHPDGVLSGQLHVDVQAFLRKLDADVDASVRKYEASQEVLVRKRNDIVLTFAQFQHR